jgi:hypothetical protein
LNWERSFADQASSLGSTARTFQDTTVSPHQRLPSGERDKRNRTMQRITLLPMVITVAALSAAPPLGATDDPAAALDKLLDRIIARERAFLTAIHTHAPLIETYIQETAGTDRDASGMEDHPTRDHYFLGRFRIGETVAYEPLVERTVPGPRKQSSWAPFRLVLPGNGSLRTEPLAFLPRGFAQMTVMDSASFNRQTYRFEYVRREFLGEVRCLVFDVEPVDKKQPGKFMGRIWVEDRGYAIVRFNGTFVQPPPSKRAPAERYFHFDSWRVDAGEDTWVPAQIYVEEDGAGLRQAPTRGPASTHGKDSNMFPRFKAQARIWDLAASRSNKLDELTSILVESEAAVKDEAASKDVSPLESQRFWERQAEENLLSRLEKGGLLAPPGSVDRVLNTVVDNLIISADLNIDARCRVLLTAPVETFSVGHTIVISRGLLDVLPDEASLALVLASELAHIALGHRTQTQFAFSNQTMLSDAELLQRFRFQRTPAEMDAASKKTIEIMRASPYKNTTNAGLFLKALAARNQALPRLLQANLGNAIADAAALARLQAFADAAPPLEEDKLEQIAALPLGSRIKLNPWNNQIELVKTKPLSLLSPREKMPFEVTPFMLHLTR